MFPVSLTYENDDTMSATPTRSRWSHAAALSTLIVASYGCTGGFSACQGGGVGCAPNYAYPQSGLSNGTAPVDDGARLRMTQAGLDFLRDHLQELLASQIGTPDPNNPNLLRIPLPGATTIVDGAITVTLGQGPAETYPTTVLLDLADLASRLQFEFVDEGRDGIRVRAVDVPVGIDARLFTEVDLFGVGSATAACDVVGTNSAYGPGIITGLTFSALISPDVGRGAQCDSGQGECLKLSIDVDEVSIDPRDTLGSGSIAVDTPARCNQGGAPANCSPECSDTVLFFDEDGDAECDTFCPVYDFGFDLVFGITGFLEDILGGLLDNILNTALRRALENIDGAPIGLSNRQSIAGTGGVISETALDLGFAVAPTGEAFAVNCPSGQNCNATKGMDFILSTGFEAAPDPSGELRVPHPCVRELSGGQFAALYQAGEFFTVSDAPLTGEYQGTPYHLGGSIAGSAVNQILYSAYNSGALCIEVSSDDVHALTAGAFPLSAGTLDLLTEGKLRQFAPPDAPAVVTIMPRTPPIVSLGAGTPENGLIDLQWSDVEISFYVLIYERYSRIFSVEADVSASLSVFIEPTTQAVSISVVDGPTIDGFNETYNELLAGTDFSEILQTLIGLAFDAALGNGLSFETNLSGALSSALGIPIFIDINAIETVPIVGTREFLNFYVTMAYRQQPQTMWQDRRIQAALVDGQRIPNTVRIFGEDRPLDRNAEYFARVDFGSWRGPYRVENDGALRVFDGKLALVGNHIVELRERQAGVMRSLTENPWTTSIWVDPIAPHATLTLAKDDAGKDIVRAQADDIGSAASQITYSWKAGDTGEWSDFVAVDTAGAAAGTGVVRSVSDFYEMARGQKHFDRISVRAKDAAGNISIVETVVLPTDLQKRVADAAAGIDESDFGCSASTNTNSANSANTNSVVMISLGAVLGALGTVRKSRRRRASAVK